MTASNTQKIPLGRALNLIGIRSAETRNWQNGRCWPCSVVSVNGAIITVKFEIQSTIFTLPQVTMPLFGPEYIRYPIQQGDKGMAISADAYIGQMSGLGVGTADTHEMPNLASLVFMPIGNANWTPADGNATTLYGPNGVVLRDSQSKVTLTLTPGGITIDMHGNGTVSLLNGDLHVQGDVVAGYGGSDQVSQLSHTHGGVGAGDGHTAKPDAGT